VEHTVVIMMLLLGICMQVCIWDTQNCWERECIGNIINISFLL